MRNSKWTVKMLATAAISMAISFLLSYLTLFKMPLGGSVTVLSMLPLMLFSWIYGVLPGITAGLGYGLLQFLQEPYIVHWAQVLLDYPIAFAMLGLAGTFRKKNGSWALPAGIVLAGFGRFAVHTISGLIFFTDFTNLSLWGGFVSSALYNGGYMGVETAFTAIIASLPPVQSMARRLGAL